MSKVNQLGEALAYFISHPADAIEIGGISSQLIKIIKIQTQDNKRLRLKVHEWLELYIKYNDTTVKDYICDAEAAKHDYDAIFYQEQTR